ncbi:MAG: hypothetical protein IAI48_00600 [Candidatus Eremiobacteraeota bacterium]|nr:hypothetical protein [Candidatus Eremiobacteraeota bacterium]
MADLGLKVDTESLAMELARAQRKVNACASERGRASNALKEAQEARDAIVQALTTRGLDLTEPELPLAATQPEPDPEEDDGEKDEPEQPDETTVPVLDGTTGAPIAAETYAMTPSPENPDLCVCGFEIASDVAGTFHDKRHEQYLASTGEAPIRKATSKDVIRIGDVTKAVSARKKGDAKKKTPPKRRGAKA